MTNEHDKEYLRALYAGMAMVGHIIKGGLFEDSVASTAFKQADAMMEKLESEEETNLPTGIVKARRKKNV